MMKKNPLLLFLFLCFSLFLIGCGGPTDSNSGINGEHVSDSNGQTSGTNPSGTRPWSASQNLINPNLFDEIPSPLSGLRFQSNSEFVKSKGIKSIEIRSYTEAENIELSSDTKEAGLNMSRKQTSTFDAQGEIDSYLDERFLDAGDPITSKLVKWSSFIEPEGQSGTIAFEEKVGGKITKHTLAFDLDKEGHLVEAEDIGFFQVMHWEDPANNLRYIAYKLPKSPVRMYVIAEAGKWKDLELAIDIDDDLKNKTSTIVDFNLVGAAPSEVVFLEWEGHKTLREFQVDHKGLRVQEVVRTYNAEGNIVERNFYWDDPNANVRSRTKYNYSPNGDLAEVLHQRQKFNDDMRITIDRYFYDETGLFSKRIQTSRVNQSPERVDLLEFMTWEMEATAKAISVEVQPGGTR